MNKKKLSIVAGILIIIGIVGSLLTYQIIAPKSIAEEAVFDEKQVSNIDINTDNTAVYIYPTTDQSIKVILEGETSTNIKKSFAAEVEDSTLFITYNEKQRSWFNFDIFNVLTGMTINVYLPEKQYELLKINNNNGRVSVDKMNASEITLNTNNGRVELNEINSTKIMAESNNGQINLTDIVAQNLFVKTDNGRITLDHVEGDLQGESSNGRISLTTENLDRNINLRTSNGKITIKTEKEPTNAQFNVNVNNGKVNILDKYQGSTTIGNGENLIELTSNNGSISVIK